MQDPVGYKLVNGQAMLTSVWALLGSHWAYYAFIHTILGGPDLRRGGGVRRLLLALRARPQRGAVQAGGEGRADRARARSRASNLWFGSHFGILVTSLQPMKISAAEAQWKTCTLVRVLAVPDRRLHAASDPTPSFSIEIPGLLSYLVDRARSAARCTGSTS